MIKYDLQYLISGQSLTFFSARSKSNAHNDGWMFLAPARPLESCCPAMPTTKREHSSKNIHGKSASSFFRTMLRATCIHLLSPRVTASLRVIASPESTFKPRIWRGALGMPGVPEVKVSAVLQAPQALRDTLSRSLRS